MKKYLEKAFAEIAQLGLDTEQKIMRLAFSPEHEKVVAYVIKLMRDCNLQVYRDGVGNVIARKEGKADLPALMMGSHLDSVPDGGNYDGVVGVLGALAIINSFATENYQNKHPLEIVVFMAEESSLFGCSTLGSKAFWGLLTEADSLKIKNNDGITFSEVLQQKKWAGVSSAQYQGQIKAFWEIHIEQGAVLEQNNVAVGLVNGIFAPTRAVITIKGEANHSGATPMNLRRDGLCGAAEIILAVEKLGKLYGADLVATVGIITATPNVMNVIAGQVELGLDVRSIDRKLKKDFFGKLRLLLSVIAIKRMLKLQIEMKNDKEPVLLDKELLKTSQAVCAKLGYSYQVMPSGAGHDSMNFAKFVPTGMIFVPSHNGLSHNPQEYSEISDIVKACLVLKELLKLADAE